MNIVKIQKWGFIGIVVIMVFILNLQLFIKPQMKTLSSLKGDYNNNITIIEKLKDKQSSQDELQKEKKFYKYRLTELNDILPNYVVPEKFIKSLKNVIIENKLGVEGLDFTKPKEYGLTDAIPTNGDVSTQKTSNQSNSKSQLYNAAEVDAKANKLIVSIFDGLDVTGVKATEKELQLSNIKDENAFKVDVNFGFSGEYFQLKNFMKKLETSLNKTTINSFSIETARDGKKIGNISISLYGFKDSKLPVYDLWSLDKPSGKNDLFSKVGSVVYDVNDFNMSDFDMWLSPITSDRPSVILSKHGSYGTGIYGDNKGRENVDLYVSEKAGRFYYKYKTQSGNYPLDNNAIEFKAATLNDIIIKIYSESRISDVDNSGMNLTVHNQTNKNINIVPYGDDKVNPRVNVTITKQ